MNNARLMTREEMDALMDEHLAAEDAGDLERALATFAENVEHDIVGPGGVPVVHGVEAVRPRYDNLFKNIQCVSRKQLERLHGDNVLIDDSLLTVKVVGKMGPMEGRGRTISFRMFHVMEMANGKITRENVWFDTSAIARQLM
ncbi:nuclear transport factor 2 family protein [Pendulispora albinea]|uniref:Nuclear transport factor 2 family protein n=1 Tax=Pendulispora albinea TaxID=2741071 RepID=A0ABZ2LN69_9BACT